MDALDYAQYLGALFVTLALLGAFVLALRRFGPMLGLARMARPDGERRLSIQEVLMLDGRRRLVVVRDGDREHVLLLGASGESVVESRPAEGGGG